MEIESTLAIIAYYLLLTLLSIPVSKWLVNIFKDSDSKNGMNWKSYSLSVLTFSAVSFIFLIFILKFQNYLPMNPQNFDGLSWALAFNTAASFVTNTNWQAYGGETTMSLLSQSAGLTVQNFISAAVGLCVLAVLIRGLSNKENPNLGNFWKDLYRVIAYFLVPLSVILSMLLIQQGVPQTYDSVVSVKSIEDNTEIKIPLGPVASQIAIKQLGTNGGGYYNVNSAHPLENPTPLSNLYQVLSILLIPAACCFAFGELIKDKRQGIALYGVMLAVAIVMTISTQYFEQNPNKKFFNEKINISKTENSSGGNMEGKETRFGITDSVIWSVATTSASNGSVNSMLDSYTPIGGMIPMLMMQLGEVIFGGVGSGLYGMLAFVIVTVFIAGLMVGRTPEYLGKKIDVFEIKMVSLVVLIPCVLVLFGTALTIMLNLGGTSISNPGAHGFSQILYAYSSMANNNGSAFGGFSSGLPLHLWSGGVMMILSRFLIIFPIIALAGSLAVKKITPPSLGTLPTHTVLFSILLIGIIFIVGALTFIPALVLGPVAEHLI